jgi:hypothetical protein
MDMDPARMKLRLFLGAEGVLFGLASLLHRGVLIEGFEHARAASAETVITFVLVAGLVIGFVRPAAVRSAAFWVQCFALLGVCVGLVVIAIGVGPRTVPDLALHALMLVTLVPGLMATRRVARAHPP